MITTDYYMKCKNGVELYRTYSDKNFYIIQIPTGVKYVEAIDTLNAPYTYIETDQPIEEEEETSTEVSKE